MRRHFFAIALLATVATAADTPLDIAEDVLAAIADGNDRELARIAAKDHPDPWLVADVLCAQGAHDAALAFAKAAPRVDVTRLPDHIELRRKNPGDPAVYEAVGAAMRARTAAERNAALKTLDDLRGAKDLNDRARIELQRGNVLSELRRYRECAEAFAEGADLAERIGWFKAAALGFRLSGINAHNRLDFGAMRYAFERLRTVELARKNVIGAGQAQMFLGNTHAELGDYDRALEYYREAEEAFLEANSPRDAAWVLNNKAQIYSRRGEYRQAQTTLEHGILLAEEAKHNFRLAHLLSDLGAVFSNLADYDRAMQAQQRALRLSESVKDRRGVGQSTGNIGIIFVNLGRHEEALKHLHKALEINRELDHQQYICIALMNIGWAHREAGQLEQALAFEQRALDKARELGDPWNEAHAVQNLARTYLLLKDYVKARQLNQEGTRLAERMASAKLRMESYLIAAQVLSAEGNHARAVYSARRAIEEFSKLIAGLADEQVVIARARRDKLYQVAANAAAAWGRPAALFSFLESARAGALLESLEGRDAIRAAAIPATLRELEHENRKAAANALHRFQEAVSKGERLEIRKRRGELDAARDALRDVVAKIQRQAKAGAHTLYPEAAPLEEIQKDLRDGDALVVYGLLLEDAVALVVSRDDAKIVRLGDRASIEKDAALRLDDRKSDPANRVAALRKRVVDPLGLTAKTKRVIISPDGALGSVPFQMLLGDREVGYIPSGTTYGILRHLGGRKGEKVLALGDPNYGALPAGGATTVMRSGLSPLPASREEAKRVGDVVLLGDEATKRKFVQSIKKRKQWRAVHLACHGFVDHERPSLSALQLTAEGEDTGTLTCGEVFGMKIPADLVVLSACETAKGRVYKAEGIVGLTRSFMLAGAPRVLCSLWKVDDEATKALMVKFYELWNPKGRKTGLSAADALKKAQEFVASHDKWKHPYYWAAWQLWGLPD